MDRDTEFPHSDGPALVALLTAARTPAEGLAILARAAGFPWESEPERSEALANVSYGSPTDGPVLMPDDVLRALTAWALEVGRPWAEAYESPTGDGPRQSEAWTSPHLVPAMLVLTPFRNADAEHRVSRDLADAAHNIWGTLKDRGPDLALKSWRKMGLMDSGALARETATWSTDHTPGGTYKGPKEWTHLAAHPNASPTDLRRAANALLATHIGWLAPVLSRPGILADTATRRACWETALVSLEAVRDLLEATPVNEYRDLVSTLAGAERYADLGLALHLGRPDQLDAVRASEDQLTTWCLNVPSEHRDAVLRVMAQKTHLRLTPAPKRATR